MIPDPERAGETLVRYVLYLNIIGLFLGFFLSSRLLIFVIVLMLTIIMLVLRKGFIKHSPLIISRGDR